MRERRGTRGRGHSLRRGRAGHEPGAAKTDKARPSQTRPVWKERLEPERTFWGTCGKHQPLTQGGQPLLGV